MAHIAVSESRTATGRAGHSGDRDGCLRPSGQPPHDGLPTKPTDGRPASRITPPSTHRYPPIFSFRYGLQQQPCRRENAKCDLLPMPRIFILVTPLRAQPSQNLPQLPLALAPFAPYLAPGLCRLTACPHIAGLAIGIDRVSWLRISPMLGNGKALSQLAFFGNRAAALAPMHSASI